MLLTVAAPVALAALYFGAIASDVYVSESRFVVRSSDHQAASGLSALLKGAGFSRAQDDTYTVHDYMRSRDALRAVNAQVALVQAYGAPAIDRFSRFNGLGLDGSDEALHRYMQGHIELDLDTVSANSTLRVSAFSAADASRINTLLLEMAERLINQLNERGRQDMVRFAIAEVATAEQAAKDAALALAAFRNHQAVFDPERQSGLQLQTISKLQDELIFSKAQLAQLRSSTPDNPQVPALQIRTTSLEAQMAQQLAKVAGAGASLTNQAVEFERLTLGRSLADKQLAAALGSLELARNEAQRKQLYLARIVQPSRPDVAVEPRRLRAIAAVLVLGVLSWGVLTVLIAGVREHRE